MSNVDFYNQLQAEIAAVAPERVRVPVVPMGIYLQEAENLQTWVTKDKVRLEAAGLSWTFVERLPALIGAARECQSGWPATQLTKDDARRQYELLSPAAIDLRDTLVHDMLFAYRAQPDVLNRVRAIAEGDGEADLVQDLNDAAVLGRQNPGPLAAIGFDPKKLDEAASKSQELSGIYAVSKGDKTVAAGAKALRDQAYTLLDEAVDEIRQCGQYAFWRDAERVKGYGSEYLRRARRKSKKSAAEPAPA
jgi:hypothetical protein